MKISAHSVRKHSENKNPSFLLKDNKHLENDKATFLNKSFRITDKNIWNSSYADKLWLYQLHYFDALLSQYEAQRTIAIDLLGRWIDENPPFKGIGWDPYPISIRIVNIVKYALRGNCLSKKIQDSLILQARYLNKRCEHHILANHIFENYKALCFAGLYFKTPEAEKWFKKGYEGLKKEVVAQVLEDGGHFELSPLYHCIFLEGLIDLQILFELYQCEAKFIWNAPIQKMLQWIFHMQRTNEEIPHFNDSTNYFSTPINQLIRYAKNKNYKVQTQKRDITYLNSSGFIILNKFALKTIIDVGNVGASYQPAHGHADTFSFELYVDQYPVLVNLGTSCYGISSDRLFQRGTSAHNTVTINDENSSEVWSNFRLARRARVSEIMIKEVNSKTTISAKHNGYGRFIKDLMHTRQWELSENTVIISDQVNKNFKNAYAYFHLHPGIIIFSQNDKGLLLRLPNDHNITIETDNHFEIIQNNYAVSFGQLEKTKTIKVALKPFLQNVVSIQL